jgi:hypothetical protein
MTNAFGSSALPTVPVSWVGVLAPPDEVAAAAVELGAAADELCVCSLLVGAAAVVSELSSDPHPAASVSDARAHAAASFLMTGSPDLESAARTTTCRRR